ncbi:zinc-binding dehydrogenase, partial [Streptomyces avidinii]
GTVAAQLAVARGITVVGTAAEHDIERVTALGATAVRYGDGWPERVKAATPQGVDFVLDTSGAGVPAESVELTGDSARVLTIADMAAAQHGVRFSTGSGDRTGDGLPELVGLAAEGKLSVPVWRTYPLAEDAQAHADLEARRNRDKAVLLP